MNENLKEWLRYALITGIAIWGLWIIFGPENVLPLLLVGEVFIGIPFAIVIEVGQTPTFDLFLKTRFQRNRLINLYLEKSHAWDRQDVAGTAEYEDVEIFEHEIRKILAPAFLGYGWDEDALVAISQADYGLDKRQVLQGLRKAFR